MTGKKLGNYEILDKLGEGGMGEVWRARDARLNRSVALKVLPSDVAGDPSRRQRFEQEAKALGALNHPNIVAVYDIGQSDGQAYMVSELVSGESLRALLERGPLGSRKLIEFAIQIADAMAAAHALGIIHRDLKPENVMITRDDRVKVLDFGLAKQSAPAAGEDTATMVLSQPGMVLGTVGYMSPEQVRGQAVDARSDIFSFGCMLYEMAIGRRAFEGKSAADVMSAILKDEPVEAAGERVPISPALDAIIRRCLEKDPARRFQSAADLAFALRSISGLSTSQVSIPPPTLPAGGGWRVPVLAVLAAAVLFALGYFVHARLARRASPSYQRLTFREGRITEARFSPDWKDAVYSANWEGGESRIYLASPGNPESRDLQIPSSRLLSVSAKGDLAVLTGPFFPDGSGTLGRTTLAGGQTRPLLERVLWADWSPDANEMAVVRGVNSKWRLEYPIGSVIGDIDWGPFGIRISPDGRRIAFTTFGGYGSAIALYVAERGGKPRRIAIVSGQTAGVDPSPLCWTPDSKEVWFRSFEANEANTIDAVDLSGNRRVVARFPGRVSLHDVAADGRILFTTDSMRLGIRGVAPGETADRDLSVLETSALIGISDDGRSILAGAVGESGGSKGGIYIRRTDGSPPLRLGDGVAFYLSPDAKWVSGYTTRGSDPRKFILMPTGSGDIVDLNIPQLENAKGDVVGWLDEDQNYLVGGAYPKKGWQYFAWNAKTGDLRPVTPAGVPDLFPLLSPDRRQFLAQCADHRWCVFQVASLTEGKPVTGLSPHDKPVAWRADGRAVYFTTHHDRNNVLPVSLLDIASATRTPWKEIRPSMPVDLLANAKITPDGKAYAYNYQYERSELYVGEGVK